MDGVATGLGGNNQPSAPQEVSPRGGRTGDLPSPEGLRRLAKGQFPALHKPELQKTICRGSRSPIPKAIRGRPHERLLPLPT